MKSAINIERDMKVQDNVLNFILENMPHGGYSTIGKKLNMERRHVRDEILIRKTAYNKDIIENCLQLVEFATGKKPE